MDLQLTGKTALISGSTKGIGFAVALGTAAGCAAVAKRFPEVDILVNNLGI